MAEVSEVFREPDLVKTGRTREGKGRGERGDEEEEEGVTIKPFMTPG